MTARFEQAQYVNAWTVVDQARQMIEEAAFRNPAFSDYLRKPDESERGPNGEIPLSIPQLLEDLEMLRDVIYSQMGQ